MNRKNGTSVKHGIYSAAYSVVVIAIVIIFNLILGQLPSSAMELDMTSGDLYTISDKSRDYLKGLDSDIEITVLAQSDGQDARLMKFLYNYAAASSRISITEIDPVQYPSALDTYGVEADNVIVTNKENGKTTTIPMYGYDGMDKAMLLYDYSRYYQTGVRSAISFDADGLLTSAVDYVTGETSGTVYTMTGHGETELPSSASELIEKSNLALKSVDLLMDGGIPQDCGMLICPSPTSDLADDELKLIEEYLQSGGKVMLLTDNRELKNFSALLREYGLEIQDGVAGDTSRYFSNYASYYGYYCISPELSTTDSITSGISANAMLLYPRGMTVTDPERKNVTVSSFITTSDSGFVYTDGENMTNGKFTIGAAASEELDTDGDGETDTSSRLIVISSPSLIDENITSTITSLSNLDIFINAVTESFDGVSDVTVPAKSMRLTYNTIQGAGVWSALFIGAIPLVLIGYGLFYWTRRRKQ